MNVVPLSKTKIETKLAIIREAVFELQKLTKNISKEEFVSDKNYFAIAEHYLRRSLEAIFDISGHILSRFSYSPANRPSTFKDIALELGKRGIIEEKFAKETLVKMAGYRNRLVHFYEEIKPEELFDIVALKLNDIEFFAKTIVNFLEKTEDFSLKISD